MAGDPGGGDPLKIVGFTGRKRSGKDTAAAVYVQAGYTRLSFASPLKNMIAALLQYQGVPSSIIMDMIEGNAKEVPTPFLGGRSPRHCMQTLGTEWGRDLIKTNLWADVLINTARHFPLVVVSDVRFPNEVETIRKAGGVVYRINRPGLVANDHHSSEVQIDELDVDGELTNSAASAEEFQLEVLALLRETGTGVQ